MLKEQEVGKEEKMELELTDNRRGALFFHFYSVNLATARERNEANFASE